MNLHILTPTGLRPQGLALLGEYLNAQTYTGPLTWVIVDDCDPVSRVPTVRDGITVEHVRPHWRWKPGDNTQAACMRAGLAKVPEDAALMIMEDDDIYLPKHIESSLRALERFELVGEIDSRYYNVATQHWQVLKGRFHASMASVACQGAALETLREVCATNKTMLDVILWKTFKGKKCLRTSSNVVGVKGMPGRPGIGVGHRVRFGKPDIGDKLGQWTGSYADNYDIFKEQR